MCIYVHIHTQVLTWSSQRSRGMCGSGGREWRERGEESCCVWRRGKAKQGSSYLVTSSPRPLVPSSPLIPAAPIPPDRPPSPDTPFPKLLLRSLLFLLLIFYRPLNLLSDSSGLPLALTENHNFTYLGTTMALLIKTLRSSLCPPILWLQLRAPPRLCLL